MARKVNWFTVVVVVLIGFVFSLNTFGQSTTYTLYAKKVPNTGQWTLERKAIGSPNGSNAVFADFINVGGDPKFLKATQFYSWTLPSGKTVTKVEIGALVKWELDRTDTVYIKEPNYGIMSAPIILSGTSYTWVTLDITSAETTWTEALIENIDVAFRRNDPGIPDCDAHLDAFKIEITVDDPGSITVIAPKGTENWTLNNTETVTWNSSGVSGDVTIQLYQGGASQGEIYNGANTGTFNWTINNYLDASPINAGDYKLEVKSVDSPAIFDQSDADFTIIGPPASLTVTTPSGGEIWETGQSCNINWTTTGSLNASVKILLYDTIGTTLIDTITSNTPTANNTYSWAIPGSISDNDYIVRVQTVDDLVSDDSNVFSISQTIVDDDITKIYGKVYDSGTDNPLSAAVITSSGKQTTSDGNGEWSLTFAIGGTYKIDITKPGYTKVYRKIYLKTGHEGVVDNSWLTPQDTAVTQIGPDGGTHFDSTGNVEIVIPAGALTEIKDIRVTSISSSKSLPGDLNATDNLEYPISLLYCGEFGPEGTTFSTPVNLRIKNTWGFEAGFQIPIAAWDADAQKWVWENSAMGTVDASGLWIEASISHFSWWDCNMPTKPVDGGPPIVDLGPVPNCPTCTGSTVDAHTGTLNKSFSIPGVKVRGGDTGLSFIYTSNTAYPTSFYRVRVYNDPALMVTPERFTFAVNSGMSTSANPGLTVPKSISFSHPSSQAFGKGIFLFKGLYGSGRFVKTGYQNVKFSLANHYTGEYAAVTSWGGVPAVGSGTGITAPEYAYLKEEVGKRLFMVSNEDSPFGRGWSIKGLKKLVFEDNRIVIVDADGSFAEYEQGVNYASAAYGAVFMANNVNALNTPNMFLPKFVVAGKHENPTTFYVGGTNPPSAGLDLWFKIDLGQLRDVYKLGLDFPKYWQSANIWDYLKIETSTNDADWEEWSSYGIPTLHHSDQGPWDSLDQQIISPFKIAATEKPARYIRYYYGYPSINAGGYSNVIDRVYAIGNEYEYERVDDDPWPKLSYDAPSDQYTLTEFSGAKTVFNASGQMISRSNPQGRTIIYQYSGGNLTRILYPEAVYMDFSYDGSGKLDYVTDSSGRVTQITCNSGNLTKVEFSDNPKSTIDISYESRGLMQTFKEYRGSSPNQPYSYTWNSSWPVVTKVTLPNGGERTFSPAALTMLMNDIIGDLDNPADYPGDKFESTFTWEDGRVEKHFFKKGVSKKYLDNKLIEKITYADITKNRYPIKITKPWDPTDESNTEIKQETTITYNNDMQVASVVSKLRDQYWATSGGTNPYTDQVSQMTVTAKNLNISYYDNESKIYNHFLKQVTDGTDLDIEYFYDDNGNLTKVVNNRLVVPVGKDYRKETSYTYYAGTNDVHTITYPEHPNPHTVELTYDPNGLVTQVKNNDNSTKTVTRNTRGEIVTITDEQNRLVTLDRDELGRVTKETNNQSNREVSYEYGGSGCGSCGDGTKVTKIIDGGGKVWQFEYDSMGNPLKMIYPDLNYIEQGYDIAGRLLTFTNLRSQTTTYDYDVEGKLEKKTTHEGETIDFIYDTWDRISEIIHTQSDQATHDYHYRYSYGVASASSVYNSFVQEENLISNAWQQHLNDLFYGVERHYYDSFGWKKVNDFDFVNRTPVGNTPLYVYYYKTGSSSQMQTRYDYRGRPSTKLGWKINETLGFQQVRAYNDTDGFLDTLTYQLYAGGSYPTNTLDLTTDQSGLITSITGTIGGKSLSITHNADLEIESVTHTAPTPFSESYAYDSRGNRLTSLSESFTFDDMNRVSGSSTHNYTYDLDGNMTEEKVTATTETKKFYYNSENRMIKFEHYPDEVSPADTVAEYKYDLFGKRIQKSVNGAITNFFWEGDNLAYELDAAYQPLRRYISGVNKDEIDGYVEYSEVSNWGSLFTSKTGWYSYVKDQVGTIYKIYNHGSNTMAETRTYDVFGNLISSSGSSAGNLGFQSKYYDSESGLNYFYHRYYYPSLGRFINEDPIGLSGGFNMFTFTENDPVNGVDPWGLIIPLTEKPNGWNELPPSSRLKPGEYSYWGFAVQLSLFGGYGRGELIFYEDYCNKCVIILWGGGGISQVASVFLGITGGEGSSATNGSTSDTSGNVFGAVNIFGSKIQTGPGASFSNGGTGMSWDFGFSASFLSVEIGGGLMTVWKKWCWKK